MYNYVYNTDYQLIRCELDAEPYEDRLETSYFKFGKVDFAIISGPQL